jgi:hypothetical protein
MTMTEHRDPANHIAAMALLLVGAIGFVAALSTVIARPPRAAAPRIGRAFLDEPRSLAARDFAELRDAGFGSLVIDLSGLDERRALDAEPQRATIVDTILESAAAAGLEVDYWIEVGRDPVAAAANAAWLHRPHKTAFYGGEPVAISDWVCINNKQVFEYQMARVTRILERVPSADARNVFLNDLLGAPEGCGCGNALCRMWDGSLGEKIALGDGPAAFGGDPVAPLQFTEAVEERFPTLVAIPVITEECEAGVTHAGVVDAETTLGYGRMLCSHPDALESYPRLIHMLASRPAVALLTLDRTFGRDHPAFGAPGAWIGAVLDRYREYDARQSLWVVIEGWELGAASVNDRLRAAEAHGAAGAIVAGRRIDQTWETIRVRDLGTEL